MVTLSVEIFYHKNKKKPSVKESVMNKSEKLMYSQSKIHTELLTKKEFGVENVMMRSKLVRPKISFINVMPREFY
nr:ionotropic receptor 25a.6 [Subpsaltria yangi]